MLGLLLLSRGNEAAGRRALERALEVAREQEALSLELRAAEALAGAFPGPGPDLERLRSVYARFREGFDTDDLREARRLLAAGGSPPSR